MVLEYTMVYTRSSLLGESGTGPLTLKSTPKTGVYETLRAVSMCGKS